MKSAQINESEAGVEPLPAPESPESPHVAQGDDVIVRGSIWAATFHMAWPMLVNMSMIALASLNGIYIAGRLGSNSQAACGIGGQIWMFMILLAVALSAATTALVARFWGSGERENAIQAARQSLLFSFVFGLASAAIGLILCRPLLHAMGATAVVEQLGWDSLKYSLAGQFPCTIAWVSNAIFRGKGDARTPMLITCFMSAIVVAVQFSACLYPFHIGISGLGMGWMVGNVVAVALSAYMLSRSDVKACLDLRTMLRETSRAWLMRLLRIGLPACAQDLAFVGSNMMLLWTFAQTAEPTFCQASYAIGSNLEEILAGFPIYALGSAAETIVGQNLGARKPDRAENAGWQIAGSGGLLNALFAALFYFGAPVLAHWMSSDPNVIKPTIQYFQVVGLSAPFFAVWVVLVNAMNGAGYTRWPMMAMVVCLVAIRLPLVWYLCVMQKMGALGAWYAIAISTTICAVVTAWNFRTSRWKLQKV